MLWDVYNSAFGSRVLVVADSGDEAIAWAKRITPYSLNWSASPLVIDSLDGQDEAVEAVESWWGDYCDYADGNERISDAEYDAVLACMHRAFDAVYDAWG